MKSGRGLAGSQTTKKAEGISFRLFAMEGRSAEGDGFAGAVAGAGAAFDAEVGLDVGLAVHHLDCLDGAIGNARFASHAFIFVNNNCHYRTSLVGFVAPATMARFKGKNTARRRGLQQEKC